MSKITSIISCKGGVGKTTTAVNISSYIHTQGKRVLAVDLDYQHNLSKHFGIFPGHLKDKPTVYDLFNAAMDDCSDDEMNEMIHNAIVKSTTVDVLPSTAKLSLLDKVLPTATCREYILKGILKHIKNEYDYIFIDCHPGCDLFAINALAVSDSVIMMLFGYQSSTNAEISAMTVQADTVSGYYDSYESYIDNWVEEIKSTVIEGVGQDTETDGTTTETEDTDTVEYEVVFTGTKIQKNWFIALHAVTLENNLDAATEADVQSFSKKCVSYTTRPADENTESETTDSESTSDDEVTNMVLDIYYLTPTEIMALCGYDDADENWARLIHKTLEMENNSSVGVLGSLFSDSSWRNNITSEYGYRTSPEPGYHNGIDIGMPMGTEICATKDGTVTEVVYGTTGYGYYVKLDHGEGVETLYAHCSELLVLVGDEVKKGDVIAKVGSTGKSTGPHCHFEVRINGESVDPSPYLP